MGHYVPFSDKELRFLNNFYCHFLWGNMPYEMAFPEGLYRANLKSVWNKTFRGARIEAFASSYMGEDLEEKVSLIVSDYSDTFLLQTPKQFYAVVDQSVHASNFTLDAVSRTINIFIHTCDKIPTSERELYVVARDNLDKFLSPIYTTLRMKGYNQADLCN